MSNARTRYDTIAEFMQRDHGASTAFLYGKPAVQIGGVPFLFYMLPGMAFRLKGRARDQAIALPGATTWAPIGQPAAASPWILVPVVHFLRWDRLSIDAMRYAEEGGVRRPSAVPSQGPPVEPPAAVRWRDGIKTLFERASTFKLHR
jgi:hypothetical protein